MSTKNAGLAKKEGYKNVRVYLEGEPAWTKAGHMVYASKGNIEKGNIVLIDLRSAKKSAAGRIARSVTIPYTTLNDRLDDIPVKAPVVLYSDSEKESANAVENLRNEGYKKVALVSGNYEGWVKAGGKTVKGPVVTDITWKRKIGKGEVSKEEFLKHWNSHDKLPKIVAFGADRKSKLATRAEEPVFADNWKEIVTKLSKSDFYTGNNDRGWVAKVDWLLKNDNNYTKILELTDDQPAKVDNSSSYEEMLKGLSK